MATSGQEQRREWRWLSEQSKMVWDYLSYQCSEGQASGSSAQRTGSIICFEKGFPPATGSWVSSNICPKLSHLYQLTGGLGAEPWCYLCFVHMIPFARGITRKQLTWVVWPIYADVTILNNIMVSKSLLEGTWKWTIGAQIAGRLQYIVRYDVSEKTQPVGYVFHRQL